MRFSNTTLARFRQVRFQGFEARPQALGLSGSLESGRFTFIGLFCSQGRISEARFRCFNCISAIAASDWVCETVSGGSLEDALSISVPAILEALEGLPPSRVFCAQLVVDALQAALEQAQKKGCLP